MALKFANDAVDCRPIQPKYHKMHNWLVVTTLSTIMPLPICDNYYVTQQLLVVLSATDVTWFLWHIVSVDNMNGWASISTGCHSHELKLYC